MNSERLILFFVLINTAGSRQEQCEVKSPTDINFCQVGTRLTFLGGVISNTKDISWRHFLNKVAEWDNSFSTVIYGDFKNRTTLDEVSGDLVINNLRRSDSGPFSLEVDGKLKWNFTISVIHEVPTPEIKQTCNPPVTSCVLTCVGDTTGAEPVTYHWYTGARKLDLSDKMVDINDEEKTIEMYTCRVENGVSWKDSASHINPFLHHEPSGVPTRFLVGLSLFIGFVTSIAVFVFIHKYKSGVWFYETESMPWTADFWKKQGNSGKDTSKVKTSGVVYRAGTADEGWTEEVAVEPNGTKAVGSKTEKN